MARIVYQANGTEVWMKTDTGSVHLAVVVKPIEDNYAAARERARICAAALNEQRADADAKQETAA